MRPGHRKLRWGARGIRPGKVKTAKFGTMPPATAGGEVSGVETEDFFVAIGTPWLLQWGHARSGVELVIHRSFRWMIVVFGCPMLAAQRNESREFYMQPFWDSALDIKGLSPYIPDAFVIWMCVVLFHRFGLGFSLAGMNSPSPKCAP